MSAFPPIPSNASERTRVEVSQRYEDVAQDGRLKLVAIPHVLGTAAWRPFMVRHPDMVRLLSAEGIFPILARVVAEGGRGPISVREPIEAEGWAALARSVDTEGRERILFLVGADVHGRVGATIGPKPANAGERIHLGRVHAEHALTRLFAPPDARRVSALPDGYDLPALPETPYPWRSLDSVLALPADAEPLDAEPVADAELVFGLDDTDPNQHVNSLVYPARLVDAALRRFAAHGITGPLLARRAELVFRKPSFAGDRVAFKTRAFRIGTGVGAVASLVAPGQPDAPPRCAGWVVFE